MERIDRVGETEGEVERLFWLESEEGDLEIGVRVSVSVYGRVYGLRG